MSSAHIRESHNMSNHSRPCVFSTNRNTTKCSHVTCSVWKVYRLGCKVSAVCKPKPVGKADGTRCPIRTRNPTSSSRFCACAKHVSSFHSITSWIWNSQIECINWGRAWLYSVIGNRKLLLSNEVREHKKIKFLNLKFSVEQNWFDENIFGVYLFHI